MITNLKLCIYTQRRYAYYISYCCRKCNQEPGFKAVCASLRTNAHRKSMSYVAGQIGFFSPGYRI